MLEILQKGGPLMGIILLCSVVALGVFFERLFYLHRASIRVGELLEGLSLLLERGNLSEALQECSVTPGPVARILQAALQHPQADRTELKEITTDAGLLELPKLERNLSILSMLATITPLIGLLGTILGLLDAFLAISAHGGYATTAEIAHGVFESLLTTAAGLAVAIPSFLAYSYLSSRVNDLIHDMERAGIEIIQMLQSHRLPLRD
ncbi:MAG: flagellar motor protein MotA [Verrucomicrobia bacterium RIFCSPHIGHO2_12_FULL_41_10]|nr:MAG: flagellar motor protein MotA [Verrucomicrobia bacterium RIFCSPHIGHO2_12_FULL_41_10]HLB33928.1 MotA/TolQ/ExbB proton channel family protein [Chthoniobacterales bacterium]